MKKTQKALAYYWKEQRRQWHWAQRVQSKNKGLGVTKRQELDREDHVTNLTINEAMRWWKHDENLSKRKERQRETTQG